MKKVTADQVKEMVKVVVDSERGFDIAQAVIERGVHVLDGRAVDIMPSELYVREEVASNYGYPDDYKIGAVVSRAAKLKEYFSELDVSYVERLASGLIVPAGWDGLIVIPKISAVKPVKSRKGWLPINFAMERLLSVMREVRTDFCDHTDGKSGPEYLRLHWRTFGAYAHLERIMPGDVLVLPGQTGIRHRGRSVRRSRVLFAPNEFGLCSFGVGVTVLLHPERLNQQDVLWIDCSGAEYAPSTGGGFVHAPLWRFHDGGLRFSWGGVGFAYERFGSASALLPE